ncbi:4396_t:CDS:2 [Diversispora eburnea]|uniref:4396_t:CDS:1 n=1 Tax=Diversispora eburnea TaxID=1213867 RepID=A0A9N9F5U5_9GLOM|nr:4396_t:CDS:2 [Diversispora eburnea]
MQQRTKSHNAPVRAPSDNVSQRWVLGLSIRVKTLTDDEYEGQIYSYDPKTNCVCPSSSSSVLNSGHPQKYDFRILKINFLKEVFQLPNHKSSIDINANMTNCNSTNLNNNTITNNTSMMNGQSTSNSIFSTIYPSVGYVQMDRLQSKELLSVKDTQAALARIGVGVTQEAQEIFDALSKT